MPAAVSLLAASALVLTLFVETAGLGGTNGFGPARNEDEGQALLNGTGLGGTVGFAGILGGFWGGRGRCANTTQVS